MPGFPGIKRGKHLLLTGKQLKAQHIQTEHELAAENSFDAGSHRRANFTISVAHNKILVSLKK